jgi:hypothetical protein
MAIFERFPRNKHTLQCDEFWSSLGVPRHLMDSGKAQGSSPIRAILLLPPPTTASDSGNW